MPTGTPSSEQVIAAKIAELQQRLKQMKSHDGLRQNTLRFCKANGVTRADLVWVYRQLPPTFITRKRREGKVKGDAVSIRQSRLKVKRRPELHHTVFAEWLTAQRTKMGLSHEQFAEKLGVHQSTTRFWERGMWYPKPDVYAKLEKLYGKVPGRGSQPNGKA
jgi:DNA-binding transcriptional regulator YiaG